MVLVACLLVWTPAQGENGTDLRILDTAIIPMAPISGQPLLIIVRTHAHAPSLPSDDLPVRFHYRIEQGGRVLATAQPKTVQIPNGRIGEIRHQITAGPPGFFHVRLRMQHNGQFQERLMALSIAADQDESDVITQRYLSACAHLAGGFTAIDPVNGEPYCACPPGTAASTDGKRCEEIP